MNLQKFIYLPLFTIIVSLPGQAKAHDNLWNGLIKKLHTDKILSMTAGLETRPVHKMYPKIISFKGIVEIPSVLHITKGDGATKTIAGQLIFDKQVICNYSPRSSKHQKLYYLEYCTDRYGANDEIYVQNKIELKLNFASSDSAILSTQIKVIRSDEVNYGIMFPYIEADIGQILMFNGDAWVPSDIEILEGKQGPQGERGEIGPQGPTGPQGIQGPSGPQGLQGERGIQGASGATGPIGPQGIPGLKGDKGDNGVPGEIGETGPMGPQGLQGPKGDKGEKGERGLSEIVVLKDEKPSGTNGGTCTKGLWIPKDLTTMSGDTGFVNLAGNKFTLQPGIYFIEASAPGFGIAHHQIKLKNIETGSDVLFGTTSISNNTSPGTTNSELMGQITLTASRTFEIQHRCAVDRVNTGFGMAAGFGTPEIYTQVKIIKKQ